MEQYHATIASHHDQFLETMPCREYGEIRHIHVCIPHALQPLALKGAAPFSWLHTLGVLGGLVKDKCGLGDLKSTLHTTIAYITCVGLLLVLSGQVL